MRGVLWLAWRELPFERSQQTCAACRHRDRNSARMAVSRGCICMQELQTGCASRADYSRWHTLQQGQLRCPGRSQSRCWRERETSLLAGLRKKRSVLAACEVPQSTVAAGLIQVRYASRSTSPGSPRAAPVPVQPAPRDRDALGGTTPCPASVSLTLSGPLRNGRCQV